MRILFKLIFGLSFLSLFVVSCKQESTEKKVVKQQRVFPGYHFFLDEIIRSQQGVFRGLVLNTNADSIKRVEGIEPTEISDGHLYYEYQIDSITNYSIEYSLINDSLEEINLQINTNDLELSSYLFCDLKDYYAAKLPNPTEDQGYVVYNCFEGERKPFVVSLSDNSSPSQGVINMLIYRDK